MRFLLLAGVLLLVVSCTVQESKVEIICPKFDLDGTKYCSIPFVEMQANYNNLDNLLVAASGMFSVSSDMLLLVDPSTSNYEYPQPYNAVEVRLSKDNLVGEKYQEIKSIHGKYVTVFGRFKAKNIGQGEWPNLIAHGIEDAYVIESFP